MVVQVHLVAQALSAEGIKPATAVELVLRYFEKTWRDRQAGVGNAGAQ